MTLPVPDDLFPGADRFPAPTPDDDDEEWREDDEDETPRQRRAREWMERDDYLTHLEWEG